MKTTKFLFALLGMALVCCFSCVKEDKDEIAPKAKVILSDICVYPDHHYYIEFNVIAEGVQPLTIKWNNPDSLSGFGPIHMRFTSDLRLDFTVTDAKGKTVSVVDEIYTWAIDSVRYDYRNRYAGKYRCEVNSYFNGQTNTYTDTLTVLPADSFTTITIQTAFDVLHNNPGNVMTYLNSNGYYTYPDGEFTGYHSGAQFINDSIYYTQSGPLGNYYTNSYKGVKISSQQSAVSKSSQHSALSIQ